MDFQEAKLHHATKAKAERLEQMLQVEYPALTLAFGTNEDASQVTGFTVTHAEGSVVYDGPKVPELADLIDACEDLGLDPIGEVDDEPRRSGSVVPEEYRALYKEVSTSGQSCGDWLANFLEGQCLTATGFNVDDFTHLLSNNEVDLTARWAQLPVSGGRGWQGRYRMNGRQVLERLVAKRGYVIGYNGDRFAVPADDLAILRQKHAKWLAKDEAKTDKAA